NAPPPATTQYNNALRCLPSKRRRELEVEEEEEEELELAEASSKYTIIPKAELKRIVDEYVRKYHKALSHTIPEPCKDSPYPDVPGLPNAYNIFDLHQGGLPAYWRRRAISIAKAYHATQKSTFLGYQCNQALHYEASFGSYMDMLVNNIGDAFAEGNFTLSSKFMERAVLEYCAALWHAERPHCDDVPNSYWGFGLTMGSTVGSLYGMWNTREYLGGKKILVDDKAYEIVTRKGEGGALVSTQLNVPRLVYHAAPTPKDNPHAFTPIAFYSVDTHYSIAKAVTMLHVRTFYAEGMQNYPGKCPLKECPHGEWPAEVPSLESGAMDLDALSMLVEFFASRGYPIFICFNYGTTFKGSYDDVALA
ncbi:hypothetical protein GOP47_0009457, partial [Adiantum capillus-veneris]